MIKSVNMFPQLQEFKLSFPYYYVHDSDAVKDARDMLLIFELVNITGEVSSRYFTGAIRCWISSGV